MMKYNKLFLTLSILLVMVVACTSSEQPQEIDNSNISVNDQASSPPEEQLPTNTPGPLAQRTQAGSFFEINEVGLGADGYVSLTNFTEVEVTLEGLYLCQGSECFALPSRVVNGNETVLIAVGDGSGLDL